MIYGLALELALDPRLREPAPKERQARPARRIALAARQNARDYRPVLEETSAGKVESPVRRRDLRAHPATPAQPEIARPVNP